MDRKYKLRNFGFAEVNGKIYFSVLFFSGLVELDIKTGRIDAIYQFPRYKIERCWLYSKVVQAGNKLVFVPDRSDQIAVFNIDTHKFQVVDLDAEFVGQNKSYYRCICHHQKFIYMFPSKAKCIIRYDWELNEVKYIGKEIFETNNDENYLRQQYEVVNGKLYMPFTDRNNILVFDLEKETIDILALEKGEGWSTINCIDNVMWMSSWRSNEIYKWDLKTQEIHKYNFPYEMNTGIYKFAFSYAAENKIFYFPVTGNKIISFDCILGKTDYAFESDIITDEPLSTYNLQKSEKGVFSTQAEAEEIFEYSFKKGKLQKCSYVKYDYEFNCKKIDAYFLLGPFGAGTERKKQDLRDLIKIVSASEGRLRDNKEMDKQESDAGYQIYAALREIR